MTTARGVHAAKKAGDIAGLVAARAKNISNIANINRASNALGYLETGAMMSMAESSLEAREVYKQTLDALNNQAVNEMGLNSVEEIPMGERIKIEEIAKQKEALAFYGNMAVLMPTNLITFGRGIKPFIPPGLRSGSAAKIVGCKEEQDGEAMSRRTSCLGMHRKESRLDRKLTHGSAWCDEAFKKAHSTL